MSDLGGFRRITLRSIAIKHMDDVHRDATEAADPELAGEVTARLLRRAVLLTAWGVLALIAFVVMVAVGYDDLVGRKPSGFLVVVVTLVFVVAVCGVIGGSIGIGRWRPRLRAAREEPWRPGQAVPFRGSWTKTELSVRFDSGDEQGFATTWPVQLPLPAAVFRAEGVRVWVNGTEHLATVMFEYGPFLVAAKRT
ncbi:hypothetical protein SAMN05421504_109187 [Amycolatopsis xylanica]|uniref:Uncharacterized protein n=1 Tax=Amycolatopsis xylanica TaxID=589385 RepID=A0A1H3Q9C3_9PSEU|nr:hypothetical protein [Amycolatopsis xylanica]SDZ09883.1 hypothetical protein SAMN05421504_109187 [Amycolatopsis xylanica]